MDTTPIRFPFTSILPNHKYQINKMLTHFFSLQEVLPRRIQTKFFDFIRSKLLDRITIIRSRGSSNSDRNRSTKTFFNFSYKKYRFHFGIYIPCLPDCTSDLLSDKPAFLTHTPKTLHFCQIPSPFIMSHHRRACVMHQKKFFSTEVNHFLCSTQNLKNEINNNKSTHASNVFNKWISHTKKEVYSNRLGIKYTVSYYANGHQHIFKKNNKYRYMYKKRYNNFSHNYSINNSTKKKQEVRFKRNCTRVFNKNTKLRMLNDVQKLRLAHRHGFLTSPSQYIDEPITHLRYSNKRRSIKKSDYNFNVPFFFFKKKVPPIRRTNHITHDFSSSYIHVPRSQKSSSLYIEPVASATPFCKDIIYPLPPDMDPVPDNIDIPNKLRPYIPDGPIYMMDSTPYKKSKKIRPPTYTYCIPGSRLWFDYLQKNIKNGNLPFRDFRVTNSSPISTHPTLDSTPVNDLTLYNDINTQQNNDLSNLQQNIMENNKRQWDVVKTQLDNIIIQELEPLNKKQKGTSTSYPDDSLEEGSTSARY
ncbi:hypothetical protein GLOIN_2v1814432 [Rhizophagus irregularis DAOM 181602=DAOM 197198]|nr:hypothetical protein GLOIN_2v1814432 [Rhizophagus irregularis DAOM 181602=DAOM 197198]